MTATLVTGGAGYIGSVVTDLLVARGKPVVVLDDLSGGYRDAVDPSVPFYNGKIGDESLVADICRTHAVEACIDFAGLIAVGESMSEPARYWRCNVGETAVLLDTLREHGVECFVFSSSAAVYGEPEQTPIQENQPLRPASPYGRTKLAVEHILSDMDAVGSMRSVSLRYFNAAGATERRRERHDPETHLIPLVLRAASAKAPISIFGTDYPTPDGTAIRDYIHVSDLAEAHLLALDHLRSDGGTLAANLGNGLGFSVAEVIEASSCVTGINLEVIEAPRRPGDPTTLVADATLAAEALGWRPAIPSLEEIIESAWRAGI